MYGMLTIPLIARLNREGFEVFTITGDRTKKQKSPGGVFAQYCFRLDEPGIAYIFQSIQPDLVIFAGAFDPNFIWDNVQNEGMRYHAALTNLLACARATEVKRFIYLSSAEVYASDCAGEIDETGEIAGDTLKKITLLQAEDLCLRHHSEDGMQVCICRIPYLYGIPHCGQDQNNWAVQLCLSAITGRSLTVEENRVVTPTFIQDAVDAIYKICTTIILHEVFYNISSGEFLSMTQIVKIIQMVGKTDVIVSKPDSELEHRRISNARISSEFFYRTKYSFADGIKKVAAYVKKNERRLTSGAENTRSDSRWKQIGKTLLPFVENLGLGLLVCFVSSLIIGDAVFGLLDLFVLYVVLIAVFFGKQQAVFSILISAIGHFAILSQSQSFFEVMIDTRSYLWLTQLFIIGMTVGYARDQFRQVRTDLRDEISFLDSELRDIKEIHASNIGIKQILSDRIVNYQDSLAKIYSIVSQLDELEPGKVIFAAIDIICSIMESKDVSIYVASSNSAYCRLAAASSPLARQQKKSVYYPDLGPLYEDLSAGKIFINHEMNPEYPKMAGAVYSGSALEIIIMIWTLDFEKMSLHQANLLSVLCKLIFESVHRAHKYIEDTSMIRYFEHTNILMHESFAEILDAQRFAKSRHITDFCLLTIRNGELTKEETDCRLKGHVRPTDYIGEDENGCVCILLTNSNAKEAAVVVSRLEQFGFECSIAEG